MKRRPRAVVDTNIFVSSLIGGICEEIFEFFEKRAFTLILSEAITKELRRVLSYKRLKKIERNDAERLLATISLNGVFVKPTKTFDICRDRKNNCVLDAAVSGKADFIVTGDEDLLILDRIENIPIITERQFITILESL